MKRTNSTSLSLMMKNGVRRRPITIIHMLSTSILPTKKQLHHRNPQTQNLMRQTMSVMKTAVRMKPTSTVRGEDAEGEGRVVMAKAVEVVGLEDTQLVSVSRNADRLVVRVAVSVSSEDTDVVVISNLIPCQHISRIRHNTICQLTSQLTQLSTTPRCPCNNLWTSNSSPSMIDTVHRHRLARHVAAESSNSKIRINLLKLSVRDVNKEREDSRDIL